MTGRLDAGNRRGFTLIEILSVVMILALVAAFVVPNLGAYRHRALRAQAERLASELELGRQRAIVTGVPHRVQFDLEGASYRLEWLATDADDPAAADAGPVSVDDLDLRGNSPLPLAAPREAEKTFQPVPGMFGRTQVLEDPFYFSGLQTSQGFVTQGESSVLFERDGTASYTEIYIEDGAGESIALDVFPLDDRVRIRREDV
jgi:type II secretion system protein H